jgi:hypothetical protein
MRESKKTWFSPKLIVLVQGEPEEAVLEGCKVSESAGPVGGVSVCYALSCTASCHSIAAS